MAKHNDMSELNLAKVFFTNIFTKKHHKLPCQHQLTAGNCVHPLQHCAQTCLQGALSAPLQNLLPEQHRACFVNMQWQIEALCLTAPGYYCSAAVLHCRKQQGLVT